MRKTYRAHGGNRAYWRDRWAGLEADDGRLDQAGYPGRQAEAVLSRARGRVLEAGCGAGRVLLHYHGRGREIVGMDFVAPALAKIGGRAPGLPLVAADVTRMPFADASFGAVLAFGLYHNLEAGMDAALAETRRVMAAGGLLCASVRADSLENRLIDWWEGRKLARSQAGSSQPGNAPKSGDHTFHKANYTRRELTAALAAAGFAVEAVEYAANMPFLYRFAGLRHPSQRRFDERRARAEGYRLSRLGAALQRALSGLCPAAFCSLLVVTARAAGPDGP